MLKAITNSKPVSLNTLGEFLAVGLINIKSDGTIIDYSDNAYEILELSKDEFCDAKDYNALLNKLIERGGYGDVKSSKAEEKSYKNVIASATLSPEGLYAPLGCNYVLPSGNILYINKLINKDHSMIISITDVTEETVKDQTLLAALEMGSSGYVYYCFASNTAKYHSHYFKNVLTRQEKQRVKQNGIWEIIHPDDIDRVNSVWKLVREERKTQKIYVRCQIEEKGLVWFKAYFCPQTSSAGVVSGITCYFTDVTETLSIEGALRMSKKNLEKALQLKTDFISRVSHEVRTPMNAMVGIADALINHHNDPTITPKLQLIQDSSVNILRILDETLDYAKLEAAEIKIDPNDADPAVVVTRVCELWQESAKRKSVTLKYKIDKSVPKSFVFDAYRYEQCLNNLVSNAIKFAEGGKVDVLLTKLQKGDNPAQLVLAVKDNGIGMTPEQEKNLFEPFKQADETIAKLYGGTGLGMKITRDIISLMGGKISVKTMSGQGTIFMVALPLDKTGNATVQKPEAQPKPISPQPRLDQRNDLASPIDTTTTAKTITTSSNEVSEPKTTTSPNNSKPQQKPSNRLGSLELTAHLMNTYEPPAPPPEKPAGPFEHLKVLVVDDNATNHLVVQSLLEGMVGTIFVANNGQEALDVLEVQDVDVVFMDIHMPVMDGIEATLAIRNSSKPWSKVRIIALTADPLYQQKRLCMNIGMDFALAKPVKLVDLKEALIATQDKDINVDTSVTNKLDGVETRKTA